MQRFGSLFAVMLLYSMFYGATVPLANAVVFRHFKEANVPDSMIFIWAPVGWALAGYTLTAIRRTAKSEGDGSDCLKFAALLSVVAGLFCIILPATSPQASTGTPMADAFSMLRHVDFLAFTIVSLVVAGMMQFYFLGTAPFMQDSGIAAKNVPAAMAFAQAMQTVATLLILDRFYNHILGPKWTLVVGAGCWFLLYVIYVANRSPWITFLAQPLHGLAYALFIFGGWKYVNDVAPPGIAGSAESLIILATNGIGLFLGTQVAGVVMDRFSVDGKFQWRKVFAVPLLCTLLGGIVLAAAVHDPQKAPEPKAQVESGVGKNL